MNDPFDFTKKHNDWNETGEVNRCVPCNTTNFRSSKLHNIKVPSKVSCSKNIDAKQNANCKEHGQLVFQERRLLGKSIYE